MTSKCEFFKYIDCVNAANKDELTEEAVKKQQELRCMTAKVLSGRDMESDCSDLVTILTSGGSEANCLAIKAISRFEQCKQKCKIHMITSSYEHKSVLKCIEQMEMEDVAEVSIIDPDYKGIISAEKVIAAIRPNTVLVSIMSANNETGADNREELIKLGEMLKKLNAKRQSRIYFHSDCVETFAKYEGFMEQACMDMASCSYYKIYGANQIGALVIRGPTVEIIKDHPLVNSTLIEAEGTHGGTHSLAAASASLHSLKLCINNRENKHLRLEALRSFFGHELQECLSNALGTISVSHYRPDLMKQVKESKGEWFLVVFSHIDQCLPNTFLFSFIRRLPDRLDAPCGKRLVDFAASKGILISEGSACGAKLTDDERGYVLKAMGVPDKMEQSAIRVSFSDFSTKYHLRLLINCLSDYMRHVYPYL